MLTVKVMKKMGHAEPSGNVLDIVNRLWALELALPVELFLLGNRYILVVCDYATRYPEAIALKSIDAGRIAEELVILFARVGIPEEILTDQGANFTSQLLSVLYKVMHMHPIRTGPYHPQTDGLVERFNQTLKSMLRKAATTEGKDWDKMLPYLLFTYTASVNWIFAVRATVWPQCSRSVRCVATGLGSLREER